MLLQKTDKARDELSPGQRTLGQRERAVLLMADGQRSLADIGALFPAHDAARAVVRQLVAEGYLLPMAKAPSRPLVPAVTASTVATTSSPLALTEVSADRFDGKRSLATTRMFLFDLCERLYARRDPEGAARWREALCEARDRDAMLAVAQSLLQAIENEGGAERAASVRERIARLLPEDTATR